MPASNRALPRTLISRMHENIARGRASRETLGVKLGEMPPSEIAKLPRAVLTRIGPLGIATMARVAAGTDDVLPAPRQPAVRIQSKDHSTSGPPPLWLVCSTASALVISAAILATMIDRPVRWGFFRSGFLSGDAVGLCNRLDRWSEDCNFVATGQGLGLADIEARLVRNRSSFSVPDIALRTDGTLPVGTIIHVNRTPAR